MVPLIIMSVFAMQAKATISSEREAVFDTDSANVGIDNRCSACISHDQNDFVPGTLRPSNRVVKGFGGTRITNVQVGTLEWSWENDRGQITTFKIPNSYYVPEGKVRLLSPQHWARTQTDSRTRPTFGERTDAQHCILFWDNGRHQRTIELGRRDNVATLTLAPGFTNFAAFCHEAGLDDPQQDPIALPAGIISDDEDSDAESLTVDPPGQSQTSSGEQEPAANPWTAPADQVANPTDRPTPVDFSLNGPPNTPSEGEGTPSVTSITNVITDEEDRQPGDLADLLHLHHRYGHISMRKLQEMARQDTIPKRLAKCRIPTCSACLYSKATRKPWRGKTSKTAKPANIPKYPGHIVSGLIAQITGFLTTKRYKYATIFVDQYSRGRPSYLPSGRCDANETPSQARLRTTRPDLTSTAPA